MTMTNLQKTLGLLALAGAAVGGCDKEDAMASPGDTTPSTAMSASKPVAPVLASAGTDAPPPEGNLALSLTTSLDPAKAKPRGEPPLKTQRGFAIHDANSAPAATLTAVDFGVKTFGFVPNLTGVMSESPALLNSYFALQRNLQKIGSLTPPEDNIVQMSIAMENECQYCVAGHTLAGKVFFNSPAAQLEAIRAEAKLAEPKFNALRDFGLQVYASRGRVTDAQLQTFLDAGYTRAQALDVVANVAAKVMSNYANQLAATPLDEQIAPMAEGLPFAEHRKAIVN